MSTNYKFNQAKDRVIAEASQKAAGFLLTKYGSVHFIGEPKVELTHVDGPISGTYSFTGKISVTAEAEMGQGFSKLDVNMSINENDIEVEGDNIQANIESAINAIKEAEPVTAALDSFQLQDDGSNYLKVSHPALEDASLGLLGKSEYAASPDKSELLTSIAKDAMARVANETKINFTGEFKEPIVEKVSEDKKHKTPKEELAEIYIGKSLEEIDENNKIVEKQLKEKKSWLTADMMSEDPEPYADSEQLEENENYVLWQTPYADHTTYWVSDKEGAELNSFNTIEEAREAMATGKGLEMLDEASMSIKEDMPMARASDHLAQAAQLEEQQLSASQEKIKTEAVNALVSALHSYGYGTAKVAEVSMSENQIDIMTTVDDGGTVKAVNIPVVIKEAKVILPKKSLVSELIHKGLDVNARLSEEFGKEVLARIAAEESRIQYEQDEANSILNERSTVKKEASGSDNMQTLGDTETLELQKHLIPGHEDLKKGDKISDGFTQWEITDTEGHQNDKNEGSSSIWKLRKCAPAKSDDKEPETKLSI